MPFTALSTASYLGTVSCSTSALYGSISLLRTIFVIVGEKPLIKATPEICSARLPSAETDILEYLQQNENDPAQGKCFLANVSNSFSSGDTHLPLTLLLVAVSNSISDKISRLDGSSRCGI